MCSMSGLVITRFERRRIAGAPVGRVAVIDRRADLPRQPEAVQGTGLILGQRLGRVEVERARFRVGGQDLERRQLKAQRLAGGGAGRDDRRAVEGCVVGVSLVRVEGSIPAL